MLLFIAIAVAILALTLTVWVIYFDSEPGAFDKVRNFFLGARMAIATVVSIWLIAIVLYAIFGQEAT